MSSFKYKPQKLKYLSNISTLDEIHKEKVDLFNKNENMVKKKKQMKKSLKKQLKKIEERNDYSLEDIKERAQLRDKIESIKEEIEDLENSLIELDYYSKTKDILLEYYDEDDNDNMIIDHDKDENISEKEDEKIPEPDISDKLVRLNLLSQKKRKVKKPTRKRTKRVETKPKQNILSFFANDKDENNTTSDTEIVKVVSNKATLFDEYMELVDQTYNNNKNKSNPIKMCSHCDIEKTLIQSEGSYVCQNCGETEHIIIESEIPNHKDASSEKPRYPYKRQNHLIEWLNQFQAKESTEIPDKVYNDILAEIKKQQLEHTIKRLPYIKLRDIIKGILKKLRYVSYYEHVPYIISKVTQKPPPILSREVEDKIKLMFKKIQEPFEIYCPPDRINFLNYSYILNKLFRILKMEEYANCFKLLKSRDKLRQQDAIWKNICNHLNWPYHPSI